MDDFNYSNYLTDAEILLAKDQISNTFPTFSLHFDNYLCHFSSSSAELPEDPCDPESSNTENETIQHEANPAEPTPEVDVSASLHYRVKK